MSVSLSLCLALALHSKPNVLEVLELYKLRNVLTDLQRLGLRRLRLRDSIQTTRRTGRVVNAESMPMHQEVKTAVQFATNNLTTTTCYKVTTVYYLQVASCNMANGNMLQIYKGTSTSCNATLLPDRTSALPGDSSLKFGVSSFEELHRETKSADSHPLHPPLFNYGLRT